MTILSDLISSIQTATGKKMKVKGGTISPLEYSWHRIDNIHYQFNIYVTDKSLEAVDELTTEIITAIADFYDRPKNVKFSCNFSSGGSYVKDNLITQILYFTCTKYIERT